MSVELATITTETLERMLKHEAAAYYKAQEEVEKRGGLCDDYWDELERRKEVA